MQSVVNIALPFFALIFTGYFAARSGLLGEKTVGGLNTFVFYFALPALLLVTTYESPTPDGAVFGLLASYYLPSFALFLRYCCLRADCSAYVSLMRPYNRSEPLFQTSASSAYR